MVLRSSTMLPLGSLLPEFALLNVDGTTVSSAQFADAPALVVMFICNHCPYVKHIAKELARFSTEVREKGVAVVAINSNDPGVHPDDSPENMRKESRARGYDFPYLFDETQEVAKAFHAACTPDFFVFDGNQKLVYRGQFDGSRPSNHVPVTGSDLRGAVSAVLSGGSVSARQVPSIGCNIKWRSGAVPDYFYAQHGI